MTRYGDWSTRTPQNGFEPASAPDPHGQDDRHTPGAIPRRSAGGPADPEAVGSNPSRIEPLLQALITRLEENDRRYGAALDDLYRRLDEISSRAGSARPEVHEEAADSLNRLEDQAARLARQVREANHAHRQQQAQESYPPAGDRPGDYPAGDRQPDYARPQPPHPPRQQPPYPPQQQPPQQPAPPPAGNLREQLADVASGFERSLAAAAPTAGLDELNARMDDLARRLDAALGDRSDAAALRSIEAQLNNLTAQFAQAQQQYARVEAIETGLVRLMDWANACGSQAETAAQQAAQETARAMSGDAGKLSERLDAVQRELHALSRRAHEIDDRTVATLESMNATLQSLTSQLARPMPRPEPPPQAPLPPAAPRTAAGQDQGPRPRQESGERGALEQAVAQARDPGRNMVGAGIPDFHQPPMPPGARGAAPGTDPAAQSGRQATQAAPDDDDFLASARRAAQAAAAQSVRPAPRKSLFSRLSRGQAPPPQPPAGESRKPRPVLVVAAILLLVISAALLYGRLKDKSAPPVAENPAPSTPMPPTASPRTSHRPTAPSGNPGKDLTRLPVQENPPARAHKLAPLAVEKPAADAPRRPQPPAKDEARLHPRTAPADAARPKLASLPQLPVEPDYPGLAVTIAEPEAAPARKVKPTPETPVPAPVRKPAEQPKGPPAAASPPPREVSPMPPATIGPQSLRLAAARGHPQAQFEIAARYAEANGVKRDYAKAAEWYARAAAQGLAPAQYRLAALHERGRGVKKDPAMARIWYERAAQKGNVRAMHNLAVMFTGGAGRKPDYLSAVKWFTEAARYGLADSQFNLGILYETGLGVKKDPVLAYQWYALAAARGDKEADKRKQRARLLLRPEALRSAERTIGLWRARPLDQEANEVRPPRGGWRSLATAPAPATSSESALVSRAQSLLNKLGYDAGVPDGKLGPKTIAAIRRFEARNGLAATGRVTADLLRRLGALTS